MELLGYGWKHPTLFALVGVGMGEAGPTVDALLVVRAGQEVEQAFAEMDRLATALSNEAGMPPPRADGQWKEVATPDGMPRLRYGTRDGDLLVVVGERVFAGLEVDVDAVRPLARSERFTAAMHAVGGS